jgi:hypothetical protein
MKSMLTVGIVVSAFAFGSMAAEARSIHPPTHHHRQMAMFRVGHHRHIAMASGHRLHHGRSQLAYFAAHPSDSLRDLVSRTAAENGVPYRLANAVVTIESSYNPHVANRSGALGLMQIKAQTARGLGFSGPAQSLLNPDVNVRYGMRYLALAYRQSGGDLCHTVMRYESGIGATHMSAENRAYCSKASSLMAHI